MHSRYKTADILTLPAWQTYQLISASAQLVGECFHHVIPYDRFQWHENMNCYPCCSAKLPLNYEKHCDTLHAA